MYEFQLSQVNDALGADPDNAELKTLKDELTNLISLTKSLAAEQSTSSSHSRAQVSSSASVEPAAKSASGTASPSAPPVQAALKAGDECVAKYAVSLPVVSGCFSCITSLTQGIYAAILCLYDLQADGRWYPARITSVAGSSADPVYHIIFKGYNNTEMVRSADIKASSKTQDQRHHTAGTSSTSSDSAVAAGKKRTSDGTQSAPLGADADRERKKKRAEKKQERTQNQAQLASEKANSWQKFAKKGQKKGYGIAGKNSMFKTPDDPLAKGEFQDVLREAVCMRCSSIEPLD